MITDILLAYRTAFPQKSYWAKTDRLGHPYVLGVCPCCEREALCIYEGDRLTWCANCKAKFNLFDFCRNGLKLEKDSLVRFILQKNEPLTWHDYAEVAKILHPHIFHGSSEKPSEVTFNCPKDRVPLTICPHCGYDHFTYTITGTVITGYCLYCGKYIQGIKKKANASGKKRGGQAEDWRRAVYRRYNGKCALCGSTELLEAHHIVPWCIDPEYRFNANNGILLCKRHHDMAHEKVWVK